MLKGTRDGILKRIQPVSIHGQVSWDVFFTDVEDPDGQMHVARIGPEAVAQQPRARRPDSGRVPGRRGGQGDARRAEDLNGATLQVRTTLGFDADAAQIDARVRRLAGSRRLLDRLDDRHPVDDPAERRVDAVERRSTRRCR